MWVILMPMEECWTELTVRIGIQGAPDGVHCAGV